MAGTVGHTIADSDNYTEMPSSICPANWRLPHGLLAAATNGNASANNSEFDTLLYSYGIITNPGITVQQAIYWNNDSNTGTIKSSGYAGLNAMRNTPLYFTRAGNVDGGSGMLHNVGTRGFTWSNTISATSNGYYLAFSSTYVSPANSNLRSNGLPVRCVAR